MTEQQTYRQWEADVAFVRVHRNDERALAHRARNTSSVSLQMYREIAAAGIDGQLSQYPIQYADLSDEMLLWISRLDTYAGSSLARRPSYI
jgi:hypothetical protein